MNKNPQSETGSVDVSWPPRAPGQPLSEEKKPVTWRRLGKKSWQFTLPGGTTINVELTDSGTIHYILPDPAKVDAKTYFFVSEGFAVDKAGCQDAVWIQYKQMTMKLYNGTSEVKETKTDSEEKPQIDGGIPFPYQDQASSGTPDMFDTPGRKLDGSSDADWAAKQVKIIREKLALGQRTTKVVQVGTFWDYLICMDPKQVLGHWSWSLKVTLDPQNDAAPIEISDHSQAMWTPDK